MTAYAQDHDELPSRPLTRTPESTWAFAAAVYALYTLIVEHFDADDKMLADVAATVCRAGTLPLARGLTMLASVARELVMWRSVTLDVLDAFGDYAARCRAFVRSLDAHSMAGVSEPPSCLAGGVPAGADVAPLVQHRPSRSVSFEPRPVDDEDAELRAVAAMLGVA